MVIATVVIAAATVVNLLVAAAMWKEMHSGGIDTHNLAVAAATQTTNTHDLAVAAKTQAEKMKSMSDAAENMVVQEQRIADNAMRAIDLTTKQSKDALDATVNNFRRQQRAWIAPTNAYFTSEIAKGAPLSWEVQYRNTGKSPALDVHPIYTIQQVPGSKFEDNTFNEFIEADEASNSCKRLEPKPGSDVAYSDQPDPYKLIFSNHLTGWVKDDVPTGGTAIVLQMCFAYKTMDEVHRTSFCYFYRAGVSPANKQMNICTAGNHAD